MFKKHETILHLTFREGVSLVSIFEKELNVYSRSADREHLGLLLHDVQITDELQAHSASVCHWHVHVALMIFLLLH